MNFFSIKNEEKNIHKQHGVSREQAALVVQHFKGAHLTKKEILRLKNCSFFYLQKS
jgi:hypothetical protein